MTSTANQQRFPMGSDVIPSAKYRRVFPRSKVKVGRISGYSMRADMVRVAWDQTKYPGVGLTVDFIEPKPAENTDAERPVQLQAGAAISRIAGVQDSRNIEGRSGQDEEPRAEPPS